MHAHLDGELVVLAFVMIFVGMLEVKASGKKTYQGLILAMGFILTVSAMLTCTNYILAAMK